MRGTDIRGARLLTALARGVVTGQLDTPEAKAGELLLGNILTALLRRPSL